MQHVLLTHVAQVAADGGRVLVVAPVIKQHELLDGMVDLLGQRVSQVRRSPYNRQVETVAGGRIMLRSTDARGQRGIQVDLILIPADSRDDVVENAAVCVNARAGEVVRY